MLAATGGSSGAPAGGFPCSPTSSVTCVFGIPYLDDGNPVHTLDAYYPTNLTDRASIVIIHGGVWKSGSSRSYRHEALYFAENGFAVFVVNYTLSTPEQPSWPQVRTDVESATRWVMGHADEYHGEDVRVGVLGGSSGGHLTALVDTDGPEHGVHPLAAVTWSGAMDLRITYNKGNKAAKNGIYHLLGCRPYECPHKYAAASPVRHVAPGDGSLLFFQSSDEIIPIAGAREMSQALRAAKVPHTLVVFKHSTKHARTYECDPAKVDGAGLPVIDDSLRWLGLQLGQPTTPTGTFCRDPRLSQLKPAGRPTP
jgi:acetyl esterase/lipase